MKGLPRGPLTRVRQSRFLRRLGLLSGGTVIGQGLVVISSPLLTRIYTPEQFGIFAVFSAISAIIGVSIGLRYEFAIPVAKKEKDALALVFVTALASLFMTFLLMLILLIWGDFLSEILGVGSMPGILWLLPPALLIWGIGSALSFWAIRRDLFRLNAANRIIQFGSQAVGQVGLGLLGLGGIGLVLGYLLGYLTRLIHLARGLRADIAQLRRPSAARLWHALRSQWHYPAFSASSSVLQTACHMLPAVLVALLYGPALAGFFALSQRVVGLPVRLFSDSASQVFLGEIANASHSQLIRLFKKTTLLFFGIGVVGMAPLLFAGPWLFALVFGEPWREAGVIVQILIPLHLARFIVRPVSQTLNVLQRQDMHLLSTIIAGLALMLSFGGGWWFNLEAHWTLIVYSLTSCAAWIFYLFVAAYYLKRATRVDFG